MRSVSINFAFFAAVLLQIWIWNRKIAPFFFFFFFFFLFSQGKLGSQVYQFENDSVYNPESEKYACSLEVCDHFDVILVR